MRGLVRRVRSGVLAALRLAVLVLLVTGMTVPSHALAGVIASTEPVASASTTAASTERVLLPPLVIIGIDGLGWDAVSAQRTPNLWQLLESGAAAAGTTVHVSGQPACPTGGWLSLSAGRGAASQRLAGFCLAMPEITPSEPGSSVATVAGWAALRTEQLESSYAPEIGTLGSILAAAGMCATAVGPGAALALADTAGRVARYLPAVSADAFECPVTMVDVGPISVLDETAGDPLPVDTRVGEVLDLVPAGSTVLVTSVATTIGATTQLGVAIATGPGTAPDLMSSASTRRDGVVRLLDLPSSLVDALGVDEPEVFQGSPLVLAGPRGDSTGTVDDLAAISVADRGLRGAASPLLNTLGIAALVIVGGALWLGRRRERGGQPGWQIAAWRWRRPAEAALLVLAAAPIASYLVTLIGWWRFGNPTLVLWLGMTVISVLLAAAVYALPRRPVWCAALGLSLVTSMVLVVDAVTGTTLHWGSPLGTSAVLGNRYYGFGNSTYAVFAVHTIVLAGVLVGRYVAAGRRRTAVIVVVAIAVVAVVVDIWPTWGADVGGGLAFVPAFGVLALGAAGQRVTFWRGALTVAAGVLVVAAVAVLDWLRPAAQRSHAGRFVQDVLDGAAGELITRKLDYAVASLGRGLGAWITLAVLAAAIAVVVAPRRFSPPSLDDAVAAWPGLRATLAALVVSAVLGSLVNDWGIRVATVILTVALPVIAVTCLRAGAQRPRPDLTVSRSASSATPPKTTRAVAPEASPPTSAAPKSAVSNRTPIR